jgi:hypothetical protein
MIPTRLYSYNVTQEVNESVRNETQNLFYFVADKTVAFRGFRNKIDNTFCYNNNIQIIDVNNEGGVIVSGKGSLSVALISKDTSNYFNKGLTRQICYFLQSKGLNISVVDNDILVDEKYKVASCSSRYFGRVLLSTFHISYEVNLELIKALCTKPMKKIPKGLKDYGITEDEILSVFYQYVYSL